MCSSGQEMDLLPLWEMVLRFILPSRSLLAAADWYTDVRLYRLNPTVHDRIFGSESYPKYSHFQHLTHGSCRLLVLRQHVCIERISVQ